jgi:pantothenate kinase
MQPDRRELATDIAELARRAAGIAVHSPGKRLLLGIAGAPGAGKSMLAAALAVATGGVIVPMDGFHLADDELRRLGRYERKGAPDTFDADGYVALLRQLRTDPAPVLAPAFDRAAEAVVADAIAVPPRALVITEGNYLLVAEPPWSAIRGLLDECWFVEVDEHEREQRLIDRFVSFGWPIDIATQRVRHGSDADNARLVARTRAGADLVVRG